MKEKKKIIGLVSAIVVLIIVIVGVSYAWLTMTVQGNEKQVLRVGGLRIILNETNSLTINDARPISDSEGMAQDGFIFSVENQGALAADYNVYLDDDAIETTQTRLDDQYVKYSLDVNDTTGTAKVLDNRLIYSGHIERNTTDNFVLRVWLNDEIDGYITNQVFKVKIRVEVNEGGPVADVLLAGVGENGAIDTSDPDQTFITGTDPNNYIWYSGKLWRAVSIDPDDNSVKLVTQWNISAISYNESNAAFEGSYMEAWLNDTSVDGFLGNLRDYENFIKTDSVWNATLDATDLVSITKPAETTMVEDAVGLLNMYEYRMSYSGTTYQNGYLNNGLYWLTLTPYSSSFVRYVDDYGRAYDISPSNKRGVRPSINLKSSVKIVSGDGTENNPYRLDGDNDSNLNGTLLNTRYSGEYIKFGAGENNLYRIVSHETSGLTKITSAEPLKSGGSFITSAFGSRSEANYSSSSTIGTFLNGEYLTSYVGSSYSNMIEPNTTWYLGIVENGASYRLAKYSSATGNDLTTSTTAAQVGLLRLGELMAGQFDRYGNNTLYWTLAPYIASYVNYVINYGYAAYYRPSNTLGVRPSMNLKSNVIITGGSGTKSDPFVLAIGS